MIFITPNRRFIVLIFGALLGMQALRAQTPARFKLPKALNEVSGLYVQNADSLWWHNDSGDAAKIYLTNARGELLHTIQLPTQATDWEDLTADDKGQFYLGDFGDNRRQRTRLTIFRYEATNTQLDSITFEYPEGQRYDVEAMAWYRDSLHIFTKSKIDRGYLPTYHFIVPAQPGHHKAILRDSALLRKRVVTAATIDAQTGELALLAYYYTRRLGFIPYSAANVYTFNGGPTGYPLKGTRRQRRISFFVATQYESLDFWNGKELLVASEKTLFIKPKAKRVRKP